MTLSTQAKDYDLQDMAQVLTLIEARSETLGEILLQTIEEDRSGKNADGLSLILGLLIGAQVVVEMENSNLARRIEKLESTVEVLAGKQLDEEG